VKLNTNNVKLRISAGLPKQFPTDPLPQVAFSGRSNVGKSSIINMLLNRKSLARVSAEPGKTITINFYDIDKKLFLVDLPGYGFAKRTFEDKKRWSSLTDGYFTSNPNIDLLKLVVQLVDSRIGMTKDDEDMLYFLVESGLPFVIVGTKADKLNKTERLAAEEKIGSHPAAKKALAIIYSSSKNGEGKDDLWRQIAENCQLA